MQKLKIYLDTKRFCRLSIVSCLNFYNFQVCILICTELRQLNLLRPRFWLESNSNWLLIHIFKSNSSSESASSQQNRLYPVHTNQKVQKRSKRSNWIKKVDWFWLFKSISTIFDILVDNWSNLIKNRSNLIKKRSIWYNTFSTLNRNGCIIWCRTLIA